MDNRILVVTSGNDGHLELLNKVDEKLDFVVLDPYKFPDLSMSFSFGENGYSVMFGNIEISDIKVVWYRKPHYKDMGELKVAEKYMKTVHETYIQFIRWLFEALPNATWISEPRAIFQGNNKVFQMLEARKLGMKLPNTLVTSSSSAAKQFVEKYQHVIVKPILPPDIPNGNTYLTMYTERVDKTRISYEGLNLTPVIFQEEVVGTDIRVTVVGNEVFPCRILKNHAIKDEVDWRKHQLVDRLIFTIDENFPIQLREQCVSLVNQMGLKFGAIEFIQDKNGYTFLEINPNGQWGFIQNEGNIDISSAFVRMFRKYLGN